MCYSFWCPNEYCGRYSERHLLFSSRLTLPSIHPLTTRCLGNYWQQWFCRNGGWKSLWDENYNKDTSTKQQHPKSPTDWLRQSCIHLHIPDHLVANGDGIVSFVVNPTIFLFDWIQQGPVFCRLCAVLWARFQGIPVGSLCPNTLQQATTERQEQCKIHSGLN